MTLFLRAHHGQIESNSRVPKARAAKTWEILIENCEKTSSFMRSLPRLLKVSRTHALSHERAYFERASRPWKKNIRERRRRERRKERFRSRITKNIHLFALITSLSQGILNACYHKRAHFERASRLWKKVCIRECRRRERKKFERFWSRIMKNHPILCAYYRVF